MSIAVIAWHRRLFGTSSLFDAKRYLTHHIELSDIINFNLLLLAVPVFFLTSIFLQVERWSEKKLDFRCRMERLAYMYVFWTGIYVVLCRLEFPMVAIWPNMGINFFKFLLSGGSSVFYFLFSLILLTGVCQVSIRLPMIGQKILAVFFLLLLWICPVIVRQYDAWHILIAFWNPLNFVVYVFISTLVYHYVGKNPDVIHASAYRKTVIFLFILFVLSAACEWIWFQGINNFVYDGYAFPSYTRISVAVGATFFFLLSFSIERPPGFIIRLLSNYSLGLYCLHVFVGFYYGRLKPGINPCMNRFVDFFLILTCSLFLSILLRRAFRKGLI
jgi:hypothetical protein